MHCSKKDIQMGQQVYEKMLNINNQEKQIETTIRHYLTPVENIYYQKVLVRMW